MHIGKLSNNVAIQEFVLSSPAPVATAVKLSQHFRFLAVREKERAKVNQVYYTGQLVHAYTPTRTLIHSYIRTLPHTGIHIIPHTHTHTSTHSNTHSQIHTHIHTHLHKQTHIYRHTHTHLHKPNYTHSLKHTLSFT